MKKVYRDLALAENVKYRRILNEGVADECTWHRDSKDRVVQIVEGRDWKIQFDNRLPVTVKPGDKIRIFAEEWHRVIPGKGDLLMIIQEETSSGDELDIAGIDAFDPRFIEDEDDMEEIEPELGNLDNTAIDADMGPETAIGMDDEPIEPEGESMVAEIRKLVRRAIIESKKKLDPNYLTKDAGEMRDEIRKHAKKSDDDPSAYKSYPKGGWKADYSPSGSRYKTKPSAATKAFHKRFGEADDLNESDLIQELGATVMKALKNKAETANAPLGALTTVYRKGLAAWKTGHRPGTSQHQWAMGRVNSFLTGGKARKVDAAQWQRVQKHRKK